MARRPATEENEIVINDNISGSVLTLRYRMPTTKERQAYQNMAVQRQRNKVAYKQAEARQKYGLVVLTGFKKGDFEHKVADEWVAFSCDKNDPDYYEDWKQWVEKEAGDIMMLLAAHVFDSPAEILSGEDASEN